MGVLAETSLVAHAISYGFTTDMVYFSLKFLCREAIFFGSLVHFTLVKYNDFTSPETRQIISRWLLPFIIMLCAIRSNDGKIVLASQAGDSGNTFYCPICEGVVLPSKDESGMEHFVHTVPGICSYGLGETKIHRRCKAEIYNALLRAPHVSDVKLERYLKEVRPDISARINGIPVAIEVQISNIPVETVIHRTKIYERMGIHLLWLAQWNPRLNQERYSPRPWERWIHTAYFGRVYYWLEGSLVMPYHFEPSHTHVKKRSWQKDSNSTLKFSNF